MAQFNAIEKAAANQAHRDVREARDALRDLLHTAGRMKHHAALDEILQKLIRAEGNIDVVLGRPRT